MKKSLNSNQLKLIAVLAMIFDHLLWVIKPGYNNGTIVLLLHLIGRIVAPIFCFFIAEGAYYTKDRKKYLIRLLIFAVISHFAYCFAFGINFIPFKNGTSFNQTSIMWSLALGLIGIMIQDSKLNNKVKTLFILLLCVLGFPSDWSSVAVMIIIYNYEYRNNFKKQVQEELYSYEKEQDRKGILLALGVALLILYYTNFTSILKDVMLIVGWISVCSSIYGLIFSSTKSYVDINRLKNLSKARIYFE